MLQVHCGFIMKPHTKLIRISRPIFIMDPSQYGNLKWVGQYEKIEAKASSNLAFCMQNLLREAHQIPSRDELKSSRVRLEKRLAEQKAREHERLYKEWMRQNDLNGKEKAQRIAKLLKRHVESWDAKNRKGDPVDLTVDNITRLHPAIQTKMLDIVLGYSPSEEADDAGN